MSRETTYAIYRVRMSIEGSRIEKVLVAEILNGRQLSSREMRREEVVTKLMLGKKVWTATQTPYNLDLKEEVHIIKINGENFLRTNKNDSMSDNLGELPSF